MVWPHIPAVSRCAVCGLGVFMSLTATIGSPQQVITSPEWGSQSPTPDSGKSPLLSLSDPQFSNKMNFNLIYNVFSYFILHFALVTTWS